MRSLISFILCFLLSSAAYAGIPGAVYQPSSGTNTVGTLPINCGGTGQTNNYGILPPTTESGSFSAVAGNAYLVTLSGAATCTLPTAVGIQGQRIQVTMLSSNALTFATTSSQTINGQAAASFTGIANPGTSYTFISDGSNWFTQAFGSGQSSANAVFISGGGNNLGWQAPLNIAHGGTGSTSLTQYSTLTGNATSAVNLVAPSSTSGYPYCSNGSSSYPSFQVLPPAAISTSGASSGQALVYNGTNAGYQFADFGDLTNWNALPTTGTIAGGVYRTSGNWTQTGAITFSGAAYCYFGGAVTFNNTVTLTAGADGNAGGTGAASGFAVAAGATSTGQGPGGGGLPDGSFGGPGGGHGGKGGQGQTGASSVGGVPGWAYTLQNVLYGSGGAAGGGTTNGEGNGGAGGGALYIEAIGNVSFGSSMTLNANGGAGASPSGSAGNGGGGGSGGGIDVRSLGTITVSSGVTLEASGGAGGTTSDNSGGAGGGGGIINLQALGGVTQSGTLTVSGGSGAISAANGSSGTTNTSGFTGPRLGF